MLDIETTDRFREAINGQGLTPPAEIVPDGEIHRYRANGDKRNTKNAWYVLYGDDLPAGAFGNWKTGESFTWCGKSTRGLSAAEKAEFKKRMDSARQQREAEILERNKKASREAVKQFNAAKPALAKHPYL
jgi:putative DNA primase/helicase